MDKDTIQGMLDAQLRAINSLFTPRFDSISSELRELRAENAELRHALEFNSGEIRDLKSENKSLMQRIDALEKQTSLSGVIDERVRIIEDDLRRNNLRLIGLKESAGETSENLLVKTKKLLKEHTKLDYNILAAYRVRYNSLENESKPRPIILKFSSNDERFKCFSNKAKLKGTDLYLNEDLSRSTLAIRRSKMDELREIRKKGHIAYFSGVKIVSKPRPTKNSSENSVSSDRKINLRPKK